ncbi:putative casparian strip membrane protein [Helianthus annuus]|nr:putative casparian strip membrane protein [Helianthus annuus]KAJ0639448.1 putative casparian strip membrane protein [Helianthus annuus]KAJ0643431.1 putative casparian strip membrane protein [Helianthus annuus]
MINPGEKDMQEPIDVENGKRRPRNYDVMHAGLRLVCLSASLASIVVMTTAKERSTLSLYGFNLPVYSKWSFSDSFE